jgi:hypothetical protein
MESLDSHINAFTPCHNVVRRDFESYCSQDSSRGGRLSLMSLREGLLFRSRGTACSKSKPISAHICSLTNQAQILEQFALALAAWLLLLPQAPWLPLGTEAFRPLPYHGHLQSIGTASPYFLQICCRWVWLCMSRGLATCPLQEKGVAASASS